MIRGSEGRASMLDGGLSEFVLAKGTCCSQRTSPRQNQSDLQPRGAATRHVLDRQTGRRCTPHRQFHAMRVLAREGLGLSDRP
jgi:hypothetical protein